MKSRYNHRIEVHNLLAPQVIVPIIMGIVKPSSVVDIGCGLGTFLKIFKELGVTDILGVDGSWCKREQLYRNILPAEFVEKDLERPLNIHRRFDLVICLEVAEHLSPNRADSFIHDLVSLGDVILFSAAIPGQGGINHLNEQWPSYWEKKFNQEGYIAHDVLKPLIWEDERVFWWYKQNMILLTKSTKGLAPDQRLVKNVLRNVIHPDLYNALVSYKEKNAVKRHIKALIKAVLFQCRLME